LAKIDIRQITVPFGLKRNRKEVKVSQKDTMTLPIATYGFQSDRNNVSFFLILGSTGQRTIQPVCQIGSGGQRALQSVCQIGSGVQRPIQTVCK